MNYYTNAVVLGNNICYRGIKNGRRVSYKVAYKPHLYVQSKSDSIYKSIHGENLDRIDFSDIRDAREFIRSYKDVDNFSIYGNQSFEYAFIADNFKHEIEFNLDDLLIAILDIETYSNDGFPDPEKADHQITAITIRYLKSYSVTFACGDYSPKYNNSKYIKCRDEFDLCSKFLDYWYHRCPDIVTGWNIQGFDIPYLYNRLNRILGEDSAKKLSPWNVVNRNQKFSKETGKEYYVYKIYGVAVLDYLDLYKQFAQKKQESYRLDFICNYELNTGKIDYSEYETLHQLYVENFDKFIDYNIIDCELIERLENKLKLIELAATLAYDTKSLFEDVFTQTRMWDAIIYNHLLSKNVIIPAKEISIKDEKFEGAYVKDPIVGKYENVVSFDLESLYPSLIEQYNLSPDTLINPKDYTDEMRYIISNGVSVDKLLNKEIDLSKLKNVVLTPNGQFFRTDVKGFLSEIVSQMKYDRKVKYKKLMLDAKKQLEDLLATDNVQDDIRLDLEKKIARYTNIQLAKKVQANSGYGTLGTVYFRFFDVRIATAITLCGQLAVRWIENDVNHLLNKLLKTENVDFVTYIDTDSCFFHLNQLVTLYNGDKSTSEKIVDYLDSVSQKILQPYIAKSFDRLFDYIGGYENKMFMKREKICTSGIFTGKKHYVLKVYDNEGVRYAIPEIVIVGLEMIKSSTPMAIRDKLKEVVELLLDRTENDLHKFVFKFEKEFKKMKLEDIAFPRSVNGVKEYSDSVTLYKKGTPVHVRGSILHNNQLKKLGLNSKYREIKEGEKIKFIYLKEPNILRENVIAFIDVLPVEFELNDFIDYNTMFEKVFVNAIENITDHIGWSVRKQNTLMGFFD